MNPIVIELNERHIKGDPPSLQCIEESDAVCRPTDLNHVVPGQLQQVCPCTHKQDRPCLRLDPAPPPTVNCKSPYKLQSYRRVGTDSACSHQQTTVFLAALSHTTEKQEAVIYISSVLKRHFLPEKLVKSRQKGEKRFLWSHCCASCGVAVGNKFWEEKQKNKTNNWNNLRISSQKNAVCFVCLFLSPRRRYSAEIHQIQHFTIK